MKHIYAAITALCLNAFTAGAQTIDTLAQINPGNNIVDIVKKGSTLFATSGTNVYKSTNNGVSWTAAAPTPDFLSYTEQPRHMLAASDNALYVAVNATYSGIPLGAGVMKSTDDGATWISMGSLTAMGGYEETARLIEIPGGNLFLATNAAGGKTYHSTLSSSAWTQSTATRTIYGMTTYNDTLVVSSNGVYYSMDQGNTWTLYPTGTGTDMQLWGSVVFCETSAYKYAGFWKTVSKAGIGSPLFTDLTANVPSGTPSYYPKQIEKDGSEDLFMSYTDAAGGCFISKSTDEGMNWTTLSTFPSTACFTRFIISGTDIIGAVGQYIVRIQNVATIGIHELTQEKVQVKAYPNPASDLVTFHLPAGETAGAIDVYNIGMQLQNTESTGNSLNTSALSAGVYFANIRSCGHIYHSKFVVSK